MAEAETLKRRAEAEAAELVRRMAAGDRDAFAGLLAIYQPKALRAAYLISGNFADSEDIVQETFVACWLNRRQLKNPGAFPCWFYKTLSRIAWRVCKKRNREQPVEELFPPEAKTAENLLDGVLMKEEEKLLSEAVAGLPVKQRTMVVLYYYNGLSIREIAAACGVLEGTVKSRLFHGKERLRKILKERGEGGRPWTILS